MSEFDLYGLVWITFMAVVGGWCVWALIQTFRTNKATLVKGWTFSREKEAFEFWFLTALRVIVSAGAIWFLLDWQ